MSDDDFSALLSEDGEEVQRLNFEARVDLKKSPAPKAVLTERKLRAQAFTGDAQDPLDTHSLEMLTPMSLLEYQRPGIQHGVYKNLRLGKYSIDASLDLHGQTVEQARQLLYQFVSDCLANDIRTALITHGKGEGRETPALLKSCVAHWLPQINDVMAFHTAQKQHGSYGATYILLRKSDNKKQKTKEQFRLK